MARRPDSVMAAKRAELLPLLAKGLTRQTAAKRIGVDINTLTAWSRIPEYSEAMRDAELAPMAVAEEVIQEAITVSRDWRAALAYLERRLKAEWAKQPESTTTVNVLNYHERAEEAAERLTPERIIALVDAADRGKLDRPAGD